MDARNPHGGMYKAMEWGNVQGCVKTNAHRTRDQSVAQGQEEDHMLNEFADRMAKRVVVRWPAQAEEEEEVRLKS